MKKFVEKIVKELEEAKDFYRKKWNKYHDDDEAYGNISAYDDAIKIVNRIAEEYNNDCCEWRVLHEGCFIQNPHTKRMFSNEESMQNVYCNTCGKKIKKII